jgi:hypothetical protein
MRREGGPRRERGQRARSPAAWASLRLAAGLLVLLLLAAPSVARADVGGCPLLPADAVWNARVDGLSVDPRSDAYVADGRP